MSELPFAGGVEDVLASLRRLHEQLKPAKAVVMNPADATEEARELCESRRVEFHESPHVTPGLVYIIDLNALRGPDP